MTAPPYSFVAELPGSEVVVAPTRSATSTPKKEKREWPVWEEVPQR